MKKPETHYLASIATETSCYAVRFFKTEVAAAKWIGGLTQAEIQSLAAERARFNLCPEEIATAVVIEEFIDGVVCGKASVNFI